MDDPEYRQSLAKRLKAGRLSPAMECMLWHYAKGKPREHVEQTGEVVYRWMDEGETRRKARKDRDADGAAADPKMTIGDSFKT